MTHVVLDELVTAADVARMLGVSRERVRELAKRDDFPAPAGRVARSLVWRRPEIEAWIQEWDRRPGRPAKSLRTSTPGESDA